MNTNKINTASAKPIDETILDKVAGGAQAASGAGAKFHVGNTVEAFSEFGLGTKGTVIAVHDHLTDGGVGFTERFAYDVETKAGVMQMVPESRVKAFKVF